VFLVIDGLNVSELKVATDETLPPGFSAAKETLQKQKKVTTKERIAVLLPMLNVFFNFMSSVQVTLAF